jgi:hypothetical protein
MIPHTNFDETKLFANFECKNGTFSDLLQKVRSFLEISLNVSLNPPPALWQDKL